MENSMAKDMAERYDDYLHTPKLEERAAKCICYWVMSTLESLFWANRPKSRWCIDFFACKEKMVIVFKEDKLGENREIIYTPNENCGDGNLPIILKLFVEIFNSIKYPLTSNISSPVFSAHFSNKLMNEGKYKDYYYVYITVDMLPDA